MNKYQSSEMSNLIDDFFFIGPPNSDKCIQDVLCFANLCAKICIPIKKSKTVFLTTVLTMYEIEIDPATMESPLTVKC